MLGNNSLLVIHVIGEIFSHIYIRRDNTLGHGYLYSTKRALTMLFATKYHFCYLNKKVWLTEQQTAL